MEHELLHQLIDVELPQKMKLMQDEFLLYADYIVDNDIKLPLDIDDHDIHIVQHTSFLLGNDFEKMGSLELKEKMLGHIKLHKKFKDIGE